MIKHKKNNAFTLIELLVVIAVIALLLSIITPSLNKAKKHALTLICGTRLKDVGTAIGMYSLAYNGEIPPTQPISHDEWVKYNDPTVGFDVNWISRIAPFYQKQQSYVGGGQTVLYQMAYNQPQFRCPTQEYYLQFMEEHISALNDYSQKFPSPKTGEDIPVYAGAGAFGLNVYFSGYNFINNSSGTEVGGDKRYNYRRVTHKSSSLPLIGELAAEPYYDYRGGALSPTPVASLLGGWIMFPWDPHPMARNYGWRGGWEYYGPAPLHDGKINYLFADGHVEAKGDVWPWDDSNGNAPKNSKRYIFHPEGKK